MGKIYKISSKDLKEAIVGSRKNVSESLITEMRARMGEANEGAVADLERKGEAISSLVEQYSGMRNGEMQPQAASKLCSLCNDCIDSSLDVFSELAISDISRISKVRSVLSQIGNALYELGIMVGKFNSVRADSGFMKNGLNGESMEGDYEDVPKKIGELERKVEEIGKFIHGIESGFKDINKKISMKRHEIQAGDKKKK